MAARPALAAALWALAAVAPARAAPPQFPNYGAVEVAGQFTIPPGTIELNNGTNFTLDGFGFGTRAWQGPDFPSSDYDNSGEDWEGSFEMNHPNRTVFPPRLDGGCIKVEPVANFSTSKFDGSWVVTAGLEAQACSAAHFSHLANGSLLLRYYDGTTDTSSTPTATLLLSYSNAVATLKDGNSTSTQTVLQTDYTTYALVLRCDQEEGVYTYNTMTLLTRDGTATAAMAAKVRSQKYGLETGFLIGNLGLNEGKNCTKTFQE